MIALFLGAGISVALALYVRLRRAQAEVHQLYQRAQQELDERIRAEAALRQLNDELENRVLERTTELSRSNARLVREIRERERAEADFRRRNRELLSLQAAIAATASSLDLPFILETVTWEMAQLLDVDGCAILEWDEERERLVVIAEYGAHDGRDESELGKALSVADYPVKRRVLLETSVHQATQSQPDLDATEFAYLQAVHVRSLLMLPMVFQARVLGMVEVYATQEERTFAGHEISLAQLLANQAASAIANARLYAEIQRRLREQTALREAGAIISSALDPDTVLARIAEQMGRAVDATSAYIYSFDVTSSLATVAAKYISPHSCPAERMSDPSKDRPDAAADKEFLEKMICGGHEVSRVDDPGVSEAERARMLERGAKTVLYIPLVLRGQVLGFAELWESRRAREFTVAEISLCHGIAQQAAVALENARLYARAQWEIAERKRAEQQIKASLAEKEVLLKEIHHRVKNNLQVVSSLLNLQSQAIQDPLILSIFQESQSRVLSMALIHEKLYRSADLARIDLGEYIRSLATELFHSYYAQSGPVRLKVNATDVFLSIEKAVPCGLIVNELVSNALKHAFPGDLAGLNVGRIGNPTNGKENQVCIELAVDAVNRVTLVVRDNGVGFPGDLDLHQLDSLGLRLINTLIGQLDGTLELRNHGGAEFKLCFLAA